MDRLLTHCQIHNAATKDLQHAQRVFFPYSRPHKPATTSPVLQRNEAPHDAPHSPRRRWRTQKRRRPSTRRQRSWSAVRLRITREICRLDAPCGRCVAFFASLVGFTVVGTSPDSAAHDGLEQTPASDTTASEVELSQEKAVTKRRRSMLRKTSTSSDSWQRHKSGVTSQSSNRSRRGCRSGRVDRKVLAQAVQGWARAH